MYLKKNLAFFRSGFSLIDKKRSILIKELMLLIDRAVDIGKQIGTAYRVAYLELQKANISLGICEELSMAVPRENSVELSSHGVMGVEIPILSMENNKNNAYRLPPFGLYNTNSYLDKAFFSFSNLKQLTVRFAEIENSIFRLAHAIKQAGKRTGVLKNSIIPEFEKTLKNILGTLEERDLEEFIRLKIIKVNNNK
jgi:V/A-type H+-transporting ATPase subunit D